MILKGRETMNDTILFLAGDYEAQKLCRNISENNLQKFIERHFLYSILLASKVIMPVGCYYQSKYTQKLVLKYEKLYLPSNTYPNLGELSIGDDRASFADDAKIKKSWFPDDYIYTDDIELDTLTKSLKNIQPSIRNGKMRSRLTSHISEDINQNSSVKQTLSQKLGSQEKSEELFKPLKKIIEVQEFAILPTYIALEMERHNLSSNYGQKRWLDFILFKGYSESCKDAYQSYCNNPLNIFYDEDFRCIYPFYIDYRDTNLFEQFIKIFPFFKLDKISQLSVEEIWNIKYSMEFRRYLESYYSIVKALNEELQAVLLETNGYPTYWAEIFLNKKTNDLQSISQRIVNNVEDALVLYDILKIPFRREQKFKQWINNNYFDLPTVQLISCIKDKKNGILKEYIKVLYSRVKNIHRKENRIMKKNTMFSLIHIGNIKQEINDQEIISESSKSLKLIKKDFEDLNQEEFSRFIRALAKSQNPEILDARTAIITVMNAKDAVNEEEYENYIENWRKKKNTLSSNALEALKIASQAAGIASFILKLLGQ